VNVATAALAAFALALFQMAPHTTNVEKGLLEGGALDLEDFAAPPQGRLGIGQQDGRRCQNEPYK